jgi:hypothetical protein
MYYQQTDGAGNAQNCAQNLFLTFGTTEFQRPNMRFTVSQTPQTYTGSSMNYPDVSDVFTGTNRALLGRLDITMNGNSTRGRVTQLQFNLNGTTLPSDITRLQVWRSGTEPGFEPIAANLVGDFTNVGTLPPTVIINMAPGVELFDGTNYFWVTANVTPDTLAGGRNLRANFTQFTITGSRNPGVYTLTLPAAGSRKIIPQPSADFRTVRVERPYDAGTVYSYPINFPLPIRGVFQNTGSLPATKVKLSAKVFRPDNTIAYQRDQVITYQMPGLPKDSIIFYEFGTLIPNVIGNYRFEVCAEIQEANNSGNRITVADQIPGNNCKDSIFVVEHLTEFEATRVDFASFGTGLPAGTPSYWAGRPMQIFAGFKNNGLVDGDLIPARVIITPPAPFPADTFDVIVPSVAGKDSTFLIDFTSNAFVNVTLPPAQRRRREQMNKNRYYIPPAPGAYTVTVVVLQNDGNPSNNTRQFPAAFTVADNMSGTYSIGPAALQPVEAVGGNFATMQDALDALYIRGVKGPVTFLLTQERYVLSSNTPSPELYISPTSQYRIGNPGLNISGKIVGVSATNTITFRAASNRNINRGVVLELRPTNGKGLYISQAQEFQYNNPFSIASFVPEALNNPSSKGNSNSNGNIIFDGGNNKTLVFQLRADAATQENNAHRAAIYIGRGVSNVAIRNCHIEDSSASGQRRNNLTLPQQVRRQTNSGIAFDYDSDINVVGGVAVSYSAGIVNRNVTPFNDNLLSVAGQSRPFPNPDRLDTLINSNNIFENNVIRGFGYGIASMGAGPVLRAGTADFENYYNRNTRIVGNDISDGVVGIFAGFEHEGIVEKNYIHGLSENVGGFAAGVQLGRDRTSYNNQGMIVRQNEVFNLIGSGSNVGIEAHQAYNVYSRPNGQSRVYPREQSGTKIYSNIIRNVQSGSIGSIGISVRTRRDDAAIAGGLLNFFLTPASGTGSLFTEGDVVAGNTVIMPSLSAGVRANGGASVLAGITLQQSRNAKVYNNAIAMLEGDAGLNNIAHAAIVYQGEPINKHSRYYNNVLRARSYRSLESDNNAFSFASVAGAARPASVGYVIETDANSGLLDFGLLQGEDPRGATPLPSRAEQYRLLSQWRRLGNQDMNSVMGDFIRNANFEQSYNAVRDAEAHLVTINGRTRINPDNSPVASVLSNRGRGVEGVTVDAIGQIRAESAQRSDIGALEFTGRLILNELESVDVTYPIGYARISVPNIEGVDKRPDSGVEYSMTNDALQTIKARFKNNSPQPATNVPVRVTIIREAVVTGGVVRLAEAQVESKVENVTIGSDETVEVTFSFPNRVAQTFGELGHIPEAFGSMYWNVTPVYRIEIAVPTDLINANDRSSKRIRLYLPGSDKQMLVSARGIQNELPTLDQNLIAGKLNADSVVAGLRYNNWFYYRAGDNSSNPATNRRRDYDVFERSAWEVYEVDYSYWRTLIWSGNTNTPYASERDDVADYLQSGSLDSKKNILFGSSQMFGMLNDYPTLAYQRGENTDLINYWLRSRTVSGQVTPLNAGYQGEQVRGVVVGTNINETILATGYPGDITLVFPRLMLPYSDNRTLGLTQAAYAYVRQDPAASTNIMGVAGADPEFNVIHYGVEWRHFGRTAGDSRSGIARVLRTSFDYFDQNEGTVVPVELADLRAYASGNNRITVTWETASEQNSALFEVERRESNAAGVSQWSKVGEVSASGYSSRPVGYMFTDEGLLGGRTYVYRLRMVDLDGSWEYSGEVEASLGDSRISEGVWIEHLLPNPTVESAEVRYLLKSSGETVVEVYTMSGVKVHSEQMGMQHMGEYKVQLDVRHLASGMYRVVVRSGENVVNTAMQIVR